MTKTEVLMRFMEKLDDGKPRTLSIDIPVGWTKRKLFRQNLPNVLLRECPRHEVEASFVEKKNYLSSIFILTLKGSIKNLNNFVRAVSDDVILEDHK